MSNKRFDIFGDIHGHAAKLEELLLELGYESHGGHFQHKDPSRMAIFVGDFID